MHTGSIYYLCRSGLMQASPLTHCCSEHQLPSVCGPVHHALRTNSVALSTTTQACMPLCMHHLCCSELMQASPLTRCGLGQHLPSVCEPVHHPNASPQWLRASPRKCVGISQCLHHLCRSEPMQASPLTPGCCEHQLSQCVSQRTTLCAPLQRFRASTPKCACLTAPLSCITSVAEASPRKCACP